MRLKGNSKRKFVGLSVCVAALGFFGYNALSPQISLAAKMITGDEQPANTTASGNVQIEVQEKFNGGNTTVEENANGQITVKVEGFGAHDSMSGSAEGEISVTIEEFLQITIPNAEEGGTANVTMEANPTSTGATTVSSAEFTVAGNNRNGFGVFVYAASDPNLNNADAPSTVVAPIATSGIGLDSENFGVNKWGYNVTSAQATDATINSFNPLAILNNTTAAAYTVDHPSAGENLKLNCGAKVDTSIPAGTYSTGVVISAVAPATNWQLQAQP